MILAILQLIFVPLSFVDESSDFFVSNKQEQVVESKTETLSASDNPKFVLKTNVLYDLVTVVNLALEVPIGEHFSVQYEHLNPWWRTANNKYRFEILYYGAEVRYWLPQKQEKQEKKKLLTGHFVGVAGYFGSTDFQRIRDICYQTRYNGIGLVYGYVLPLSPKINMEFAISLGYNRIRYDHYIPSADYSILYRDRTKTGVINYFGPTKLGISLALPIGKKQ